MKFIKYINNGALRLAVVWLALKVSFLNSVEHHTAIGWCSIVEIMNFKLNLLSDEMRFILREHCPLALPYMGEVQLASVRLALKVRFLNSIGCPTTIGWHSIMEIMNFRLRPLLGKMRFIVRKHCPLVLPYMGEVLL